MILFEVTGVSNARSGSSVTSVVSLFHLIFLTTFSILSNVSSPNPMDSNIILPFLSMIKQAGTASFGLMYASAATWCMSRRLNS
ncbi:MAG: hypothetical protein KBF93_01870 [Leptospiraceae bacterium]|nr:hypothetical protein [Leptospiraceae bacterium]